MAPANAGEMIAECRLKIVEPRSSFFILQSAIFISAPLFGN
jgi:hypothetical protein